MANRNRGEGDIADDLVQEGGLDGAVPVGETDLDEAPERIKKFPHSRRFERSVRLIKKAGWFYHSYVPNVDMRIKAEPDDYAREVYAPAIKHYTGYKHTYMVDFHVDGKVLKWWTWRNHSDIGASVIERKFPIDYRIRDIITAFKMLMRRNQRAHVFAKRLFQTGFAGLLVLAAWAIAKSEPILLERLGVSSAELPGALILGVSVAFAGLIIVIAHLYAVGTVTSTLRDKMTAAAGSLSQAMSRKTSGIQNKFTTVLRRVIHANNDYLPNEREWIEDALWYIQVAMWLPKRVDYIERFFQLEMQNIRANRNAWAIVGDWSSRLVLGLGLAGAAGVSWVVGAGSLLVSGAFFAPMAIALIVMSLHSTSRKNSIQNTEIRDWIGERSWVSVSEFDSFKEISEVMRHYMHRVFTEDNKGATLPSGSGRRSE